MNRSRLTKPKRVLVIAGWLAAAGLCAACSMGGSSYEPTSNSAGRTPTTTPTPGTGASKTSSSLLSADPRAQYFVIKRTFASFVADPDGPYVGQFDINSCYYGSEQLGVPEDDPVVPLADLAYEVVYISKVMKKAGYPEPVWAGALFEFEGGQLARRTKGRYVHDPEDAGYRAARQKIVRAANEYREETAGDLPEIIDEGGCGAGGVGVVVVTRPAGGRVNFIPVFFHKLCRAQDLNPDDTAQCDRWREPVDGTLTDVSGDYFYRAVWPDGTEKRGQVSFTNVEEGQTVTFNKP